MLFFAKCILSWQHLRADSTVTFLRMRDLTAVCFCRLNFRYEMLISALYFVYFICLNGLLFPDILSQPPKRFQ